MSSCSEGGESGSGSGSSMIALFFNKFFEVKLILFGVIFGWSTELVSEDFCDGETKLFLVGVICCVIRCSIVGRLKSLNRSLVSLLD